jgi:GDP-L-fucose synthase
LTKPDGTPRKLMNVDRLTEAGWKATTTLEKGIRAVYESLKDKDWY